MQVCMSICNYALGIVFEQYYCSVFGICHESASPMSCCASCFTSFQDASVSPESCAIVTTKEFDASALSNLHAAVGNGQHVACAGLALLTAFASIQIHDGKNKPQVPAVPQETVIIGPAADGRCFFSCCYLWCLSSEEKEVWMSIKRNQQGFAAEKARQKHEETLSSQPSCL